MSECKIVKREILYDRPAETDAFTGGGHARTAKGLARLIRIFDGETRAIGLEGRWGSGKSSIVKMANNTLETKAQHNKKKTNKRTYHIFTYDLWAHQTGNFRRTFLEQLIVWLKTQPQSDNNFLNEIYNQITNRTINTSTKNEKTFSWFGLIVLVFILFLPLIYMWLSPFAFTNESANASGYGMVASYALGIMAFLTIAHILYTWWKGCGYSNLFHRLKCHCNKMQRQQEEQQMSLLAAISRTLSLFSKDAETTCINQRIREIDPSQHEFEKTFKDIIAGYQTDKQRIIIVFDNVDRLPKENIQDAWANIHAIASANHTNDGVERKVTLIIPYDREHILTAITTDEDDEKVKEDLLRKSFDAILFVAPPVISDASAFF